MHTDLQETQSSRRVNPTAAPRRIEGCCGNITHGRAVPSTSNTSQLHQNTLAAPPEELPLAVESPGTLDLIEICSVTAIASLTILSERKRTKIHLHLRAVDTEPKTLTGAWHHHDKSPPPQRQLALLIVNCPSPSFGPKFEGATLESLNAAGEEIHGAIAGVYWSMVVGGFR